MFQSLFLALLFAPVLMRIALGTVFGSKLRCRREIFWFTAPLVLALIPTSVAAYRMGAYGLFIPFMLILFWTPQLILIYYFGACERESFESVTSSPGKQPSPASRER